MTSRVPSSVLTPDHLACVAERHRRLSLPTSPTFFFLFLSPTLPHLHSPVFAAAAIHLHRLCSLLSVIAANRKRHRVPLPHQSSISTPPLHRLRFTTASSIATATSLSSLFLSISITLLSGDVHHGLPYLSPASTIHHRLLLHTDARCCRDLHRFPPPPWPLPASIAAAASTVADHPVSAIETSPALSSSPLLSSSPPASRPRLHHRSATSIAVATSPTTAASIFLPLSSVLCCCRCHKPPPLPCFARLLSSPTTLFEPGVDPLRARRRPSFLP